MAEHLTQERDLNGDRIFPDFTYDVAADIRKAMRTHVFHFKDAEGFLHQVDYNKGDFTTTRTDLPDFKLKHYSLFARNEPATDEWFAWMNRCHSFLSDFFAVVFKNRMPYGITTQIDKYELVLPEEQFLAIKNFITDAGLDEYRDFIFYLIAKIEEIYVHDIEFDERPEQKKQIKNFPKEVEKLHTVLKRFDTKNVFRADEMPSNLEKIVFQYDRGSSVKIENPLLLSSITKGTIKYFSGGVQRNWEKQLKDFPAVYDENQLPDEFRHRICKALHNFFVCINVYNYAKAKIPEKELDAIARILDFAMVKFHNRKGTALDIDVEIYDIKKHIRAAISRKEMINHPTHLTAKEIAPDLELLKKYFDLNFLSSGMQTYDYNDLRKVAAIISRFDLEPIAKEFLHIYDCLKQRRFQIGHQFETLFNPEIEKNEDYRSWKSLFSLFSSANSLGKVVIKPNGDSDQLQFSEELSLELIRQALSDFYEKNKFEFDNDFYEAEIKIFKPHGSFQLVPTGNLNTPSKRFFPVFTKKIYSYLLKESPPADQDWKPSEKYFNIIAMLFMTVFEMGDLLHDEDHIVEKVKQWYLLD